MTEEKPDLKTVKAEIRESVADMTDLLQKAANLLLLAHGAAIVTCLTQLKDYGANPNLRHIGIAIAAFAAGFIVALLAYIDIGIGRLKLMLGVFQADRTAFVPMPLMRGVTLLYISAGSLLGFQHHRSSALADRQQIIDVTGLGRRFGEDRLVLPLQYFEQEPV